MRQGTGVRVRVQVDEGTVFVEQAAAAVVVVVVVVVAAAAAMVDGSAVVPGVVVEAGRGSERATEAAAVTTE